MAAGLTGHARRYYRVFDNHQPMKELTEQEAVARGSYIVEEHGAFHRYRRYSDGKLSSIIYDGVSSPEAAIADIRARREGVPADIFSSSTPAGDGGYRWREWHLDREGNIEWISEPEYRSDGGHRRITTLAPDGALEHFTD